MAAVARLASAVTLLLVVLVSGVPARAGAQLPPGCTPGRAAQPSRCRSSACRPAGWNGQLVVYAPGYTPPQLPLGFYQLDHARRRARFRSWS